MPILNKIYYYQQKQIKYKKELTNYLFELKADIVVSAMRRDINFLNDIKDGSIKIGEIHFNKSNYREFNKPFLPNWLNTFITKQWRKKLIKEIKKLKNIIVLRHEKKEEWSELQNIEVIPKCTIASSIVGIPSFCNYQCRGSHCTIIYCISFICNEIIIPSSIFEI